MWLINLSEPCFIVTISSIQTYNSPHIHFAFKQLISRKMEGKTVILSVLIVSLVMAQVQGEPKSCCPKPSNRNCYNICYFAYGIGSHSACATVQCTKACSEFCTKGSSNAQCS
ncbi:hypothetical protein CARUB_v10006066mg [Capsella rubella]|uniref:Thionin-like protein n=1 Tax=Capsella rubella TaxID=81985 RepID=R0GZE7_9BRAS|nr:hypothetical protein CARUB_v10006066mg [Capsella rubella]